MVYNFKESYESQRKHYNLFKEWLIKRDNIAEVWDGTPEEDDRGIDLYAKTTSGRIFTLQIKVDFKTDTTGNIPLEVISQAYSDRTSKIGAEFAYSNVEYIFFILGKSNKIIGFKFRVLLKYVIEHYNEFRNFKADNGNYKTLGCLVPLNKVEHLVTHRGIL